MIPIFSGESQSIDKVSCSFCHSFDMQFVNVISYSKKQAEGGLSPLGKVGYEKNTVKSVHRCQKCGRITLYSVGEARS